MNGHAIYNGTPKAFPYSLGNNLEITY